jgi:Raf kinase inhibitor-like YbhB/YbcL family protein
MRSTRTTNATAHEGAGEAPSRARWAGRGARAAVALGAAAALAATGTAVAEAHGRTATGPGHASAGDGGFGYHAVRAGVPDGVARFAVSSPQVRDGGSFPASAWADSMGCTGGNQQVTLDWHGAPAATKGYAVTMFDPDAPTGGGFWHWLVWDIPAGSRALGPTPPAGAVSGTDDAGVTGWMGPCPPAGDVAHHYEITVYALDTASLGLPAATPAAVTAFTMSGHVIGYARMTVTARR